MLPQELDGRLMGPFAFSFSVPTALDPPTASSARPCSVRIGTASRRRRAVVAGILGRGLDQPLGVRKSPDSTSSLIRPGRPSPRRWNPARRVPTRRRPPRAVPAPLARAQEVYGPPLGTRLPGEEPVEVRHAVAYDPARMSARSLHRALYHRSAHHAQPPQTVPSRRPGQHMLPRLRHLFMFDTVSMSCPSSPASRTIIPIVCGPTRPIDGRCSSAVPDLLKPAEATFWEARPC